MLAFTARQAKGLTCWQHDDGNEGMQTCNVCYVMIMENTQRWILMIPRCLFLSLEMDIKGKTEKHHRFKLSVETWAIVSDWWSKKFRHSVLRKKTAIVHSFKIILSCFFFLSPYTLFLPLSVCIFHTFYFSDPFLKGQTDYNVSLLSHAFIRCRDCSHEWKGGTVTLRRLCCSPKTAFPHCPWDFYSMTSHLKFSLSDHVIWHLWHHFCALSYLLRSNIAVFKDTQAVLISIYSCQQR